MARVKGPLFSLEASGSVAKTIVYAGWKGRQYTRKHVVPVNPQTEKQVNVRTAMTLLVTHWKSRSDEDHLEWRTLGNQFTMSGFNVYVRRGMAAYVVQLTVDVTPSSVHYTGVPPTEVWVWI